MGDSVDDLELNREEEWLMLCIFEETFSTQIKNQRPEQFDGPVMKGRKWYSLKKESFNTGTSIYYFDFDIYFIYCHSNFYINISCLGWKTGGLSSILVLVLSGLCS